MVKAWKWLCWREMPCQCSSGSTWTPLHCKVAKIGRMLGCDVRGKSQCMPYPNPSFHTMGMFLAPEKHYSNVMVCIGKSNSIGVLGFPMGGNSRKLHLPLFFHPTHFLKMEPRYRLHLEVNHSTAAPGLKPLPSDMHHWVSPL